MERIPDAPYEAALDGPIPSPSTSTNPSTSTSPNPFSNFTVDISHAEPSPSYAHPGAAGPSAGVVDVMPAKALAKAKGDEPVLIPGPAPAAAPVSPGAGAVTGPPPAYVEEDLL